MYDLGMVINLEKFIPYIDIVDSLPVITKVYGESYNVPDYPCLMRYNSHLDGYIAFTRNTHYVLKDMCDEIASIISMFINTGEIISPTKVHVIKTEGSIPPHIDEGGRRCCINIGLKNSSSALTRFGIDNERGSFCEKYVDFNVIEGHGYLVNVARLHAVIGNSSPRYLITYGVHNTYSEIYSGIR